MEELCSKFIHRLREHGLAVRNAASPGAIQEFESNYGVKLPLDMAHFFRHVNGMAEDALDPVSYVRVWPIEELRSLSEELPDQSRQLKDPERAFVFADHLHWSFGYAVWLSSSPAVETPVFMVGDNPPVMVSESFFEFLNMYVHEPIHLISSRTWPKRSTPPDKDPDKDPHQG